MNKETKPIEAKNLTCSLGGCEILSGINFTVEKGKFYSIIGPNGSGKTTLLRTIAAAVKPESGELLIDNISVCGLKEKELARKLSYVSQNTNSDVDFNVLDYVLMGRYPYLGLLQREGENDLAYARRSMEITNTWYLREKKLDEISGGERQRVVAARALTQDTPIILLDEPISQLDIHHQVELMDTLDSMVEKHGITVVAVLHDLNMASQYSDFIILINKGKAVKCGSPDEVLSKDIILEVYDMEVQILKNPETDKPLIIPSKYRKRRL
ncbi:iron complex transport system ATP-binding protein [Ruminiclostridium sufflavum DSM 19573]|uniref:Iron complex transport system ATP-binding protein n=1 Tax=Ruminiclostridium sufflavum DSM 19573 TaxID=1121337 RepID=A0A318XMJ7_9FIRM|nr:ABC transporter ATP-binding protein [Ruminiclostridium sufflavum]PYG89077.1 iron complex transport system ATP-binding protein [Ruminiclostridium sufflavum DSM 19573]